MSLVLAAADAATQAAAPMPSPGGIPLDLLVLIGFIAIFYLIVWRPQSKRAKEHRELISNLQEGDEILTNGGLVGKVTKIEGDYLSFSVSDTVELKLQRSAVAASIPKGTISNI